MLELTDDDWHDGMEVYFLNAVRPSRLVTSIMQLPGGGAIINISTFAAFEPNLVFPASGAMRAGLAAFRKLFADNYAAENIRMNNVLPGSLTVFRKRKSSVRRYQWAATAILWARSPAWLRFWRLNGFEFAVVPHEYSMSALFAALL